MICLHKGCTVELSPCFGDNHLPCCIFLRSLFWWSSLYYPGHFAYGPPFPLFSSLYNYLCLMVLTKLQFPSKLKLVKNYRWWFCLQNGCVVYPSPCFRENLLGETASNVASICMSEMILLGFICICALFGYSFFSWLFSGSVKQIFVFLSWVFKDRYSNRWIILEPPSSCMLFLVFIICQYAMYRLAYLWFVSMVFTNCRSECRPRSCWTHWTNIGCSPFSVRLWPLISKEDGKDLYCDYACL